MQMKFNQTAINTSSDVIVNGLEYIEHEIDDSEAYKVHSSIIPYVLEQFGHSPSTKFLNNWWDDEVEIDVLERPADLALTVKLINKYDNHIDEESSQALERAISYLKSYQSIEGNFAVTTGSIGMPLLVLTNESPNQNNETINRAITYINQKNYDSTGYRMDWHDAAAGIIALSKLGYDTHSDTIRDLGDYLIESIENHNERWIMRQRMDCWVETTALSLLEQDTPLDNIIDVVIKEQADDGSWNDSAIDTAVAIQSLITAGHGPKISKYESNWEMEKREQRYEQARPQLVRTVPIDPTASYHAEIQKRAEELIKSASEELRINSLYIDMLYEPIIDKQIAEPDLDIRIVTRGRDISGNRKRIKKDVLDELIKATEGSVKEHNRVHSRMIISDQDAVLVSSADLTRDQLRDEFNAGILTHDKTAIEKSIGYFDQIWDSAERVKHK